MRCSAIQNCNFIRYASGKSSAGLSRNNDSNMVCEVYRADALVKHIVDQECQDMGKCSERSAHEFLQCQSVVHTALEKLSYVKTRWSNDSSNKKSFDQDHTPVTTQRW